MNLNLIAQELGRTLSEIGILPENIALIARNVTAAAEQTASDNGQELDAEAFSEFITVV